MVTTSGTIAGGFEPLAPPYSVLSSVPLSETQIGEVGLADRPHALTRFGSCTSATPGWSDNRLVWTYELPAAAATLVPSAHSRATPSATVRSGWCGVALPMVPLLRERGSGADFSSPPYVRRYERATGADCAR